MKERVKLRIDELHRSYQNKNVLVADSVTRSQLAVKFAYIPIVYQGLIMSTSHGSSRRHHHRDSISSSDVFRTNPTMRCD